MFQSIIQDIDHSIFREYDIRGIYQKSLNDCDAYNIGRAFASLLLGDNKLVTILRDGRFSSKSLADSLIAGLIDCGANIINLGIGPTPLLYFSNYNIPNVTAGIMITGSHNPPSHNGFKFMHEKKSFFGSDLQKMKNMILNEEYDLKKGNIVDYDILQVRKNYIAELLESYNGKKKLKIAWDPGNGASCEILNDLCTSLEGEHILINNIIDGSFPNHHPDPTIPENLTQLIDVVLENQCDLGIAFDGDGDRIGVVDNKGRIIWGDQLLSIYASAMLIENKNRTIIADVKASNNLFELINKLGGNAIMWKTGHSLIMAKMQETSACLAGEMSGHIFFADKYYGYDDGMYAAIRLLDLLSSSNLDLSHLLDILPKSLNTPEIRIECDEHYKFKAVDKIKQLLIDSNIDFIAIDGVRVNYPNGWWLIRASNTQAAIITRCEANNKESLDFMKDEVKLYLNRVELSCNMD